MTAALSPWRFLAEEPGFRRLWIARIGAAARNEGLSYSQFMHGLKTAGVELDRKVLADLAATDSAAFGQLAAAAKQALGPAPGGTPASA